VDCAKTGFATSGAKNRKRQRNMKGFRPGVAIFIIIAEVDAILVPLIVGVKYS
jgi:hypothetical protein